MLRAYIDQCPDEDWDESLPYLIFAYKDMPIAMLAFHHTNCCMEDL